MNLLKILDGTPEPPIIELDIETLNDSGDYHLPTPMYEFQKELTDQIVSLHYPDILKYCETNDNTDLIVKSLQICIDNCMLVSTHPYLLINHYMPKNLSSKDMPSKIAETSGKFTVLKDLMNVIISNNASRAKNVGLVMNNNVKFFDLAEALLIGCTGNLIIKRYVGNNVQRESKKATKILNSYYNDVNNTTVHLLPFDGKLQKDKEQLDAVKFDVLIVFDGYVDTKNEFFETLRTQNRRGEAIVIRLVPLKTIEHCKLYYAEDEGNEDYIYKLISSIVCLRDYIGNLPPDIFPIYNQKLTFLSHKFFDEVFKSISRTASFPSWPLPDLPKIPRFSAIDVERSLLTEVHFHYTPYDSADTFSADADKPKDEEKPTYYETKRLVSEYVTNPLKNSFQKLIGIHSNGDSNNGHINSILTHKLIMQLNTAYLSLQIAERECSSYVKFNEPEIQSRFGRREKTTKATISTIYDDISHSESRVSIANKWIIKKSENIVANKEKIKELEETLSNYIEINKVDNKTKEEFIKNQLEIWETQAKIKETIERINAKNEEKNYITKEYQNSVDSIKESETQIEATKEKIASNKRKYDSLVDAQEEAQKTFKAKKQDIINNIKEETLRNESLRIKLNNSLKFLKDTSHLKKRKGRGLTPNSK
ncbi:class II histone deacetylase complex subunits 2 and 3-domain-containing protein [Scheffersomyces xylosifermentans]|uniref:class II histone deacetylase complex subunits 2 and 3-domain-containing protein n=1 Tax=Scheffersomyces xylosifermentans TaxID=1304137 RepID=UPI00315D5027